MNQYIRTNDEGQNEFNYDLLDMGARANFLEDVKRWAADIEVDLESEPDASNAERAEALNDAATLTVKRDLAYLSDYTSEDVIIDEETQQWVIEIVISQLAQRYEVAL